MAPLVIFPGGIPTSDATRARMEAAADIKAKLLDAQHTSEMYGPGIEIYEPPVESPMDNPDELSTRWGNRDIDKVCDDMAGNVLPYGGFVEDRLDVAMSLELTWLPGIKGDAESEDARDEIQAAYEAIPDRYTVERALMRCAERGFQGAENVFGVHSIGPAKGVVSIVEMYNRPMRYFGFDTKRAPWLLAHGRVLDASRIDEYKVTFSRQGSLHTNYGSGFAQRAYPSVFAVDTILRQHNAAVERWSWMPVIIRHPASWSPIRRAQEYSVLKAQWKNILLVPGDVEEATPTIMTEGAIANAASTGTARMELARFYVSALAQFVRGSQSTSGADTGSNAKEVAVDTSRMWKAPQDAAARESMWNRGLVEPTMLANRPQMDRTKWPRASVDSSFGEDLALFIEACERGVKMGVPISWVTYSERTGIALAQDGEPLLEAAKVPSIAPVLPDGLAADEEADPITGAVTRMSEPSNITVTLGNGKRLTVRPSTPFLVETAQGGQRVTQARNLTGGGHLKLISAGAVKLA